ncbi:MAG: SRPBCC family protein, partial [Planctomycetia bacterium]|nr:SRPBCC family protein [Planctomycetia bacterium]
MSEPEKKSRSFLFKACKFLLFFLVLAAAAIAGLGLFVLDGQYEVTREITIQSPPEAVHQQVGDLREWPNWLPFTKHDQSVKTTIEQPTGADARQHWTSAHGTGKLNFTASDEQKGVAYTMLFDEKYPAQGWITYTKVGDDTRVTWRMTGQNGDFVGNWLAAAMPMMVGPAFEEGLNDLKTKVEAK